MKPYYFMFFISSFLLLRTQCASQCIEYSNSKEIFDVRGKVEYLVDESGLLNLSQAKTSKKWVTGSREPLNFGVTCSTVWIRMCVQNPSAEPLILALKNPLIDSIRFYSRDTTMITGDAFPFNHRPYRSQNFLFDITAYEEIYLKLNSREPLYMPLFIEKKDTLLKNSEGEDFIGSLYLGFMLVICLYNLFLYFSIKDSVYIIYVLYIFFITLVQAGLVGLGFKFLWPENIYLQNHLPILNAIASQFMMAFTYKFISVNRYTKYGRYAFGAVALLYVVIAILSIIGFRSLTFILSDINGIFVALVALFYAIKISLKGYRPAYFFLTAWTTFLSGVVLYILVNENIIPSTVITRYMMPVGSALEAVLLSFALADRINTLRKEKQQLIQDQNIQLEKTVAERTKELESSNEELQTTYENLKAAQSRMATLGQLTASIAHDINNPLNYISMSVEPLKAELEDLTSQISSGNAHVENMQQLISSIDTATLRIIEIVKTLRSYSKTDLHHSQQVDLTKVIDSALTLLQYNLKGKIDVQKNLEKELIIKGNFGKLSQLFLNLLTNAIQAIDAAGHNDGTIKISGTKSNESIVISIEDNGAGMTEEVQKKIFEPFYTTKEEGTGLGLAEAQHLLENYSSQISVTSSPNQGSTFTLTFQTSHSPE